MKYFLLIGFCVFSSALQAQSDTAIIFSDVVKVDSNTNKGELFSRARRWVAESFKDSKEVLEIADKDAGELVGKGRIQYNCSLAMAYNQTSGWITFTFRIYVKDGRYKYIFDNFAHEGTATGGSFGQANNFGQLTSAYRCPKVKCPNGNPQWWCDNAWNDIVAVLNRNMGPMISTLRSEMLTPSPVSSDW